MFSDLGTEMNPRGGERLGRQFFLVTLEPFDSALNFYRLSNFNQISIIWPWPRGLDLLVEVWNVMSKLECVQKGVILFCYCSSNKLQCTVLPEIAF